MLSTQQLQEYTAVRTAAGVWLRTDAALLIITGADRFSWLQGMISNDTTLLTSKSATRLPACILDATGHLLSTIVLTVSPDLPDTLFMELPASENTSIQAALDRYLITEDVEITSSTLVTITLQGPGAGEIAADLLAKRGHAYYAADHTGSGGFDTYVPAESVAALLQAAEEAGAKPISIDVRELLRIEAGIPEYGVDMNSSTIALEAGLGPTHISFTKGCYVGQEIIARIDSRGHTNRALTGMVVTDGPLPTIGDTITPAPTGAEPSPRETGRITSAAPTSPAMSRRPIALGYVRHEHREPGSILHIGTAECVAEVIELPFWRG